MKGAAVVAATPSTFTVTPQTMLPDLLAAHPHTRAVFDRYGLRGCGGRLGPVESLRFFARAHGVDEDQLLREVNVAIASPAGGAPTALTAAPDAPAAHADGGAAATIADTLYRRFFTAGIVAILTVGATWGAYLLWRIGFAGDFTGISIHDVNAHGHAQIFGWVGLFIMGFAYQAFPRMWHSTLAAPRLAVAVFMLMLVGIVTRTAGMTLAGSTAAALPLAMFGGACEIAAVAAFIAQLLLTFHRAAVKIEPYLGFIFLALAWFMLSTLASVWHTWNTMTAPDHEALLGFIATFQAPLRDLQIHGLALFMILGVSLRMLPGLFDAPRTGDARAWAGLAVLTLAVIGEVHFFIEFRYSDDHRAAAMLIVPWLMLLVGVGLIALPWRLWRPLPDGDRSAKFIRAAYGWLTVSLLMLLALPVYQLISNIPFSHAYYGAIRHAVTVGFISLMIMGFAAKVVPTLNGADTRTLTPLWGPFILVNLGCFLRVSLQTLTDWHSGFFPVVGISGVLEVTGLAWWGLNLIGVMRRGRHESDMLLRPAPAWIEPTHTVADVLAWFPQTEPLFVEHGFAAVRNPVLRRTVARAMTIGRACAMHGVDGQTFIRRLNENAQPAAAACHDRIETGAMTPLTVLGKSVVGG
jgi:hypothetical protein